MVGLTCCYVLLLKMVLIRAFVANPANVAITRFFCLFFTQKFTQKNRILAEFWQKFCLKNWPLEALTPSLLTFSFCKAPSLFRKISRNVYNISVLKFILKYHTSSVNVDNSSKVLSIHCLNLSQMIYILP